MPVRAKRNCGYKPQPATAAVMMRFLDTAASGDATRGCIMPEFSELLDMLPETHYRSKTGQVLVRIADLMLSYEGNVFTDTQTGRSVNWKDFGSLASAKGLPIKEVEVETGDDGQRWTPLKWLRSQK